MFIFYFGGKVGGALAELPPPPPYPPPGSTTDNGVLFGYSTIKEAIVDVDLAYVFQSSIQTKLFTRKAADVRSFSLKNFFRSQ